jgi:hypothetical protein
LRKISGCVRADTAACYTCIDLNRAFCRTPLGWAFVVAHL